MRSRMRRLGPIGASLLAAALTAVAFAAVSAAKDDESGGDRGRGDVLRAPGPPPMAEDLSAEDREALGRFRSCMQEQGVKPPPRPGGEEGPFERRLKPPSEKQRKEMERAFEACGDELPEGARPGQPGAGCPPPGVAPGEGAGGEGMAIPPPPGGRGSGNGS